MDVPLTSVPGQLLSRFAKDLDCLDTRLPALLAQALTCVAALFSALAAIVVSSPALAPMAVALALVMWRLAAAYSPVASDAARLVSVFNGPVVAHLLECLEGRADLRSFGRSDDAMRHALAVLEVNARSQILNVALQRWFALQLEIIGAVMLFCVAMTSGWRTAHLGMSGLSLTYALTLTALAKYLVNYGTRALAQFASVERLLTLSQVQAEEEVHAEVEANGGVCEACEVPENWPMSGTLELQSYWPHFAQNKLGGPVFEPLTLKVLPREHVALVGSSGAGKSTLLAGLSRLLPGHGSLRLSHYEARQVPLQRWRKALLCVPQQPLLLAGSVRRNLDPEGEMGQDDSFLWEALRLVGLEPRLRRHSAEASPFPSPSSADGDEREYQCGLDVELDLDMEPDRAAKVPDASPQLRRNAASLGRIAEERQSGYTSDELPPGRGSESPASRCSSSRKLQLTGSERRLLVLARLLLRRHKAQLVILDEPFAAMEQNEVTPLHHMLKVQLAHATMLTVTHRLLPVIHFFSRVLVFEEGRCVQDAPPSAATNETGPLHELYLQAPARLQGHVERMLALTRSEAAETQRKLG
ncbi:unnamed protein product [Cladocopium goreaui]|uniref:Pleiotropic ABC efflux transporter of multiple drugs YBT1 n=1 Tax=Cladocopium goreaui TaxID=2562237 RepID=A0A9P1GL75_9DINO|nr:unnamed protein product [Cladocopium goreaui]